MKAFSKTIIFAAFLFLCSCTDGTNVGQKIAEVIKENKLENITIESEAATGNWKTKTYSLMEAVIEGQFIRIGDEYINLGQMETMAVKEKTLIVRF
jgi:hypothetical protein